MKIILATILVIFAGVAHADQIPPGALVWSGSATVDNLCYEDCYDTPVATTNRSRR